MEDVKIIYKGEIDLDVKRKIYELSSKYNLNFVQIEQDTEPTIIVETGCGTKELKGEINPDEVELAIESISCEIGGKENGNEGDKD